MPHSFNCKEAFIYGGSEEIDRKQQPKETVPLSTRRSLFPVGPSLGEDSPHGAQVHGAATRGVAHGVAAGSLQPPVSSRSFCAPRRTISWKIVSRLTSK